MTEGSGTVLVTPVVAATATYDSEVPVRFPDSTASATSLTSSVKFCEANNSTKRRLRQCRPSVISPQPTLEVRLPTPSMLGPGPRFGLLILERADAVETRTFFAYNHTQTPSGDGLNVAPFAIGSSSDVAAGIKGSTRQAATPVFQNSGFVTAPGTTAAAGSTTRAASAKS